MRISVFLPRSMFALGVAALFSAAVFAGASGEGQPPVTYPASQVTTGEPLFVAYCGFCHGRDAMGGETGPDLTRSVLVSEDVKGDKITPVVRNGRPDKGMPALTIGESELTSIVAFIHDRRTKAGSLVGARRKVAERGSISSSVCCIPATDAAASRRP